MGPLASLHQARRLVSSFEPRTGCVNAIPWLPTEIWEVILDYAATDCQGNLAAEFLASYALVCWSWWPRCHFHLCSAVHVRSHKGLTSLCLFLSSYPSSCHRIHKLRITGRPQDSSWASCVPLHLPLLPSLRSLALTSIDINEQHPVFYRAYRTLVYPLHYLDHLDLRHVLFHDFSQIARLAFATRGRRLTLVVCPDSRPTLNRIPPRNPWLVQAKIQFTSRTQFMQAPWGWFQACPNLVDLELGVAQEALPDGMFAPDGWSRFSALFQCMQWANCVRGCRRPMQVEIRLTSLIPGIRISECQDVAAAKSPMLRLRLEGIIKDVTLAKTARSISIILPLIASLQFKHIELDLQEIAPRTVKLDWSEKAWQGVDEALLQHIYSDL